MAKDGTARGGTRIGSGRKGKTLSTRIIEGNFSTEKISTAKKDFEPPTPKKYIDSKQKKGYTSEDSNLDEKTYARQIYEKTYAFLKDYGCENLVPEQLVESYSQMTARHIQCEELLTQRGLLAPHPTTGEPSTSPFVKMSLDYLKSANQLWYQIYQVVKENSTGDIPNSADDTMEGLLRIK